jgi:hypothetical protein
LKTWAAKIATGLYMAVWGAYGVLLYLHATLNPPVREIEDLKNIAAVAWIAVGAVVVFFQWRNPRPIETAGDLSPARSGTIVVIATGFAIAIALGWRMHHLVDLAPSAAVAMFTLVVAGVVYRFASRFPGQIGEARFESGKSREMVSE